MAANFLHGVETIEVDTGARPVRLVKTAVVGLVGTAAAGAVNTPILVASDRDFAQFGENVPNSTILDALAAVYAQKPTVCVVLNVLDPAVHKTAVTNETVALGVDGTFKLAHAAVASVVVKNSGGNTTYALDTDYTIDLRTGKGVRVSGGAIVASTVSTPNTLKISYDYADPSLVTASDIIGSVDGAGHRLGLKALRDSFQLFGFYPKILIAPVYSALASVSAELVAQASALRAVTFVDAPIGITPQQAITGRGPAGSINFNISSERAGLCYPHVKAFDPLTLSDVLRPLSSHVAGALSRRDQEQGYWWSMSNTEILGITGLERLIDAMINDPNSEANLLNEAGIITVFNAFGTGLRVWGNRSAAWPSSTSSKNFLSVRRTADVIAESIDYFTLQFIDRPLDNALIDALVESVNAFIRTQRANGAVIDGRCWFDPADNPPTQLAAGHLTLSVDFMPPTPAERVTYKHALNIEYLAQLGRAN